MQQQRLEFRVSLADLADPPRKKPTNKKHKCANLTTRTDNHEMKRMHGVKYILILDSTVARL